MKALCFACGWFGTLESAETDFGDSVTYVTASAECPACGGRLCNCDDCTRLGLEVLQPEYTAVPGTARWWFEEARATAAAAVELGGEG